MSTYDEVVAANITAARARRKLSQKAVAERMASLGFGWRQQIVAAAEIGRRRVTVGEILGLALALETTIGELLDPTSDEKHRHIALPSGAVLPGGSVSSLIRFIPDGRVTWEGDKPRLGEPTWPRAGTWPPPAVQQLDEWGMPARPQQQPVVAAIVTSDLGVLVGRRVDGTPPWTFIAGEVEPGERPEDAAVREVKEETGLEIEAGERIGERDHPVTGRHMIYLAGTPVRGTKVIVGDEAELAEVRWVSLAEADELLPGMFGPVREYLEATIGAGSGS